MDVQSEYEKIIRYLDTAQEWEGISAQTRVHVQDRFQMLFTLVKVQQQENELLNADKELLQSKWEAQGLMIQKLHEENGRYGEAVKLSLMTLENNNLMNDEYKRIHAILDGNGNLDTPEFLK